MESAPTAEGRAGGQPGNRIPPPRRTPCRGRCSHRPGQPHAAANTLRTMANGAAKRVGRNRPGGRRAGCPHPAGPRGGANVSILKLPWCGGRERPPYKFGKTRRPPRRIHAAARSPGRIWNPPLRPRAGPVGNRETAFPRHAARLVGADARIGPGNPTPPQTLAGEPCPSPTDHSIRPGGTPRPVSNIAVSKR